MRACQVVCCSCVRAYLCKFAVVYPSLFKTNAHVQTYPARPADLLLLAACRDRARLDGCRQGVAAYAEDSIINFP